MTEQQKVAEAVARVTADLERGVYLTRTIQNNPRPVAYVLIDDVRTLLAELDKLRQRLAEAEADIEILETCVQLQGSKLALAEQDARRYRKVRNNALWAKSHSGFVRWSIFLQMEEPPIDAASLTPDSVAQCLDAAIDAIDAAIDDSGEAT